MCYSIVQVIGRLLHLLAVSKPGKLGCRTGLKTGGTRLRNQDLFHLPAVADLGKLGCKTRVGREKDSH